LWQTACIDGTKIILETTAKEFGNDVNKPWRSAEASPFALT